MYSWVLIIIAAWLFEKIYIKVQTDRSVVDVQFVNYVGKRWRKQFENHILEYIPDWENGC